MIFDLHNHTIRSYDGFSSDKQIIEACLKKGIQAISITEHDIPCLSDKKLFSENNIELIPGCEFTTNEGAHIIGLFISKNEPMNLSREAIINHIKNENGLVLMPHPYKESSGYMKIYEEDSLLYEFDFIEILNGGWNSIAFEKQIVNLSNKYNMRMIASSDSHKACQVGLCVTKLENSVTFNVGEAQEILRGMQQENIRLLIDTSLLKKSGRKINILQKTWLYQFLLKFVPKKIRRIVKLIRYNLSDERHSQNAFYSDFTIEND